MRPVIRRSLDALSAFGLWAAVLLALPGCRQILGLEDPILLVENLPKGARPHNSLLLCDIEKPLGRHCATDRDKAVGIRLADAAIALVEGRVSAVGLDDSPAALARCGGEPEAVLFEGAFPNGLPVCLNCGSIATNFAGDGDAACQAACYDLFGTTESEGSFIPDVPPDPVVKTFCDQRARVSTNFPRFGGCFEGGCSDGIVSESFEDPRRFRPAVTWTDGVGVAVSGLDLIRMSPLSAGAAGAASSEWVPAGDTYVEFGVTRSHRAGIQEIQLGCGPPCTDLDPGVGDITFAIDIGADGRISLFDRGVRVTGPNPGGFFGASLPTERFRVHARDNGDGTATISYARVLASCLPGQPCPTATLHTSTARARYPLRADGSLLQTGAAILDARIVYIR